MKLRINESYIIACRSDACTSGAKDIGFCSIARYKPKLATNDKYIKFIKSKIRQYIEYKNLEDIELDGIGEYC